MKIEIFIKDGLSYYDIQKILYNIGREYGEYFTYGVIKNQDDNDAVIGSWKITDENIITKI